MAHWPAAAFGDVGVHALQGRVAFGSIDESCHESRERLLIEQRFRPAALTLILAGASVYLACQWAFATVGRGTPGPWDAPRRFVAAGPYRWVRNPIYIGALLVLFGEAWLCLSVSLLLYAVGVALGCHLFVVLYEEPTLRRRFGAEYEQYRSKVGRWIPHPPESTRIAA